MGKTAVGEISSMARKTFLSYFYVKNERTAQHGFRFFSAIISYALIHPSEFLLEVLQKKPRKITVFLRVRLPFFPLQLIKLLSYLMM